MRKKREARRAKAGKARKPDAAGRAAAKGKAPSTVSRTA
jgi:hypothetical protein